MKGYLEVESIAGLYALMLVRIGLPAFCAGMAIGYWVLR
jgi:hypothetical protein